MPRCPLLVLALLCFVPAARADGPPQTFALVIGVNGSADKSFEPRRFAEQDARKVFDVFNDPARRPTAAGQARLLLGGGKPDERATRANILAALRWLVDEARPEDQVVLVQIGRAVPLEGRSCFVTADASYQELAATGLTVQEITRALAGLKSRHCCALLDVDTYALAADVKTAPAPLHGDIVHAEYRALAEPFEQRIVLAAAAGSRRSLEANDGGLFAQLVLSGLDGAADEAGGGRDGLVTAAELARYLKAELSRRAEKLDPSRVHSSQLLVDGHARVTLAKNPADRRGQEELLQRFGNAADAAKLEAKHVDEGKALLASLPLTKSARELRKLYEQFAAGKVKPGTFLDERARLAKEQQLEDAAAQDYAKKMDRALTLIRFRHREELSWRDLTAWSVAGLFRGIATDVPASLQKRLATVEFGDDAEPVLARARLLAGKHEELDKGGDVAASLDNVLAHIDIRAEYLDKQKVTASLIQRERVAEVGLVFWRLDDGGLEVVTVVKGSPAYQAGIRAGDTVTRFTVLDDDQGRPLAAPLVYLPSKKMTAAELSNILAGKPGTRLRLTVLEKGQDQPKELTLKRAEIHREDLLGVKRNADDSWDYLLDPQRKIFYVEVPSFFGRGTAEDLTSLLARFDKQGIRGLILDLRSNPGGLLKQAIDVADLLIGEGTIAQVKCRSRPDAVYRARREDSWTQVPLVVLVDHATASSAEALAACLQDHERAVLVGERTLGKGSVQEYFPFDGGQIKLSTGATYRSTGQALDRGPNWTTRDRWGVVPDHLLPLSHQEYDALKDAKNLDWVLTRAPRVDMPVPDRQLDLALELLKKKLGGK